MARFLNDRNAATGQIPGSLIHLGSKKMDKSLVRLINYNNDRLTEKELDSLNDCLPYLSDNSVSWISLYGLHDNQMVQQMGELFEVHSLLLEDMLNTGQRPKIAETDKYLIIIMKILDFDERTHELSSNQVSMILDDSFLITLQEKEGHYFEPIRDRIRKGTGRARRKKADYLTYVLLDTIVDNYLINIEKLGNIIEKTEARIFTPRQKGLINEIYRHKTEINFLRKNIRPVKEIVHQLIENESGFVAEDNLKYFHDLNDLVMQASETIEIYQMMLSDQMNIYNANLDLRANEIMKVLTIFSAFFIPLTFISGVYGTNFENIPELKMKYGYVYFWILLILITASLIVYFKKRKWF